MRNQINIEINADEFKNKLGLKDGKPGEPGKQGPPGPVGVGKEGPPGEPGQNGSPDTGIQIIHKINQVSLTGPKISATQIEGLSTVVQGAGFVRGMAIGSAVLTGTVGSVLFVDASGNLGESNANFFWNNSIKQLTLTSTDTTNYLNGALKIIRTWSGSDASSPITTMMLQNTGDTLVTTDYQNEIHLVLQAGTTTDHRRYINFRGYDGLDRWIFGANGSNAQITFDGVSGVHRQILYTTTISGNSYYNSAGTGIIILNGDLSDASGTGGVQIWSGGAAVGNVVRFTFSGAGTLTVATGDILMSAGSITLANGQAYKAKRNTSGTILNALGFVAATDILQMGMGGSGAAINWQIISTGGVAQMTLTGDGKLGLGNITATARIQIQAGTATANTAPLKFTSGTNLTTAEVGAMEYNGTNLFFTRTGTTRENVLIGNDAAAAPTTAAAGAVTNRYGGATNFLGDPNSWASVVINGTTYKVPLYT